MLIAILFTLSKNWKQSRCPSIGIWINKLWYIHEKECYSAIKKNELSSYTNIWMNLKCRPLRERSQSERLHNV